MNNNFFNQISSAFDNQISSGNNQGNGNQQQVSGFGISNEPELPSNRNVQFGSKRLTIEKQLGEGGFAFVYQVVDQSSGQRYAMKKIMTQQLSSQQKAQVKNEVQLWKQINNHKNIISIHGVEQASDSIMILCDLCTGGTLFDLILKYDGKMKEQQIIHVLIDVCNGLQHMHENGIQHRDIKVENILLDQQKKTFRLCDFGSASKQVLDHNSIGGNYQAIDDQFEYFEKYTTMMYRPPEMIDKYMKFKVDTHVDVWMLGCVIFSMCFGYHPFQDCGKIGILNAQYFMPINDYDVDNRISQKLKDLIHIILVPNPEERPNIDQLLQILQNWEKIPKIKLTQTADSIRIKNLGGQEKPQYGGSKKKVGNLTYEDMAILQEKIKAEQQQKTKKKQHIPLQQSASLNQYGGGQKARPRPQHQQQQRQQQQTKQQDDMFDFGGNGNKSNQAQTFDFNAYSNNQSHGSAGASGNADFFDFGGSGSTPNQTKPQQSNGSQIVQESNLLGFAQPEPPKKPGSLLEEMTDSWDEAKPQSSTQSFEPAKKDQNVGDFFDFVGGEPVKQDDGKMGPKLQKTQQKEETADFFQF